MRFLLHAAMKPLVRGMTAWLLLGGDGDAAGAVARIGDKPDEPSSPFDALPAEMVENIMDHLAMKEYVDLCHADPGVALKHSSRVEWRLLVAAARQVGQLSGCLPNVQQRLDALYRTVVDLYTIRAELLRPFSPDDPPEELKAAADRLVLSYHECRELATLAGTNVYEWMRNCQEVFLLENLSATLWPFLPKPFRDIQLGIALKGAAERSDAAAFGYFLATGTFTRAKLMYAIDMAIRHGLCELLPLFLQKGAEHRINDFGPEDILGYAFRKACGHGRLDFVRALLRRNEAGDALLYGPFGARDLAWGLENALSGGHHELVKHLLLLRDDRVYDPVDAFKCVVAAGHDKVVASLLKRHNGLSRYPELVVSDDEVRRAAEDGQIALLKVLLASLSTPRIQQYLEEARSDRDSLGQCIVEQVGWDFVLTRCLPTPPSSLHPCDDDSVEGAAGEEDAPDNVPEEGTFRRPRGRRVQRIFKRLVTLLRP